MPAGYNPLAQKRVQRMFQALMDVRQIPGQLKYLQRVPMVDATDEEIMARLTEKSMIADVVANDQAAVVRNDHQVTLESMSIPNIKRGTSISQSMLNLLQRIQAGSVMSGEANIFENYIGNRQDRLLTAVREQLNLMAVGMMLDSYSWSGLGINITVTFGTPSDLKITVGTTWATAATATPIEDILTTRRLAREKYGYDYNRVTLSTTAFNNAIATTEFRNKVSGLRFFNFDANTFPNANEGLLRTALSQTLDGMAIEIDDSQYGREDSAGAHTYNRYLPAEKVILSNTADDGNMGVHDLANGVVTETIVGSMGVNGAPRLFDGPQYGPVSFATLPNADLNPPNANLWGVARAFPRKHRQASTAVLTVG